MQTDAEKITDILQRLETLEAGRPADVDAAKVLLSGALPKQRIHWCQEIAHTDRFAVGGLLVVWTISLHNGIADWPVGWASGISSLLIGLWRLNVRNVDAAIARLYPAIARYEIALGIPHEASTLLGARQQNDTEGTIREKVEGRIVGSRGHLPFDWAALFLIIAMAGATLKHGNLGTWTCCDFGTPFHPFVLLLFNATGVVMVLFAMNCFQTDKGGIRGLLRRWR